MEGAGGAETGRETPETVTAGAGIPAVSSAGQKSSTAASSTAPSCRQEQKLHTAPFLSSKEQDSPAAAAFIGKEQKSSSGAIPGQEQEPTTDKPGKVQNPPVTTVCC